MNIVCGLKLASNYIFPVVHFKWLLTHRNNQRFNKKINKKTIVKVREGQRFFKISPKWSSWSQSHTGYKKIKGKQNDHLLSLRFALSASAQNLLSYTWSVTLLSSTVHAGHYMLPKKERCSWYTDTHRPLGLQDTDLGLDMSYIRWFKDNHCTSVRS